MDKINLSDVEEISALKVANQNIQDELDVLIQKQNKLVRLVPYSNEDKYFCLIVLGLGNIPAIWNLVQEFLLCFKEYSIPNFLSFIFYCIGLGMIDYSIIKPLILDLIELNSEPIKQYKIVIAELGKEIEELQNMRYSNVLEIQALNLAELEKLSNSTDNMVLKLHKD